MLRKRLLRYFTPSPGSLTLAWAALIITLIIGGTVAVLAITDTQVDILFGISLLGLPLASLILTLAALKEKKSGTRAVFWIIIALMMLISVVLFANSMKNDGLSDEASASLLCCSPFGIIPGIIGLFFATKTLPELRNLLQIDRAQRAAEILSARGEATYSEIGTELDLSEDDVEALLTDLPQSEGLEIVLNPVHKRAETLTNLLEKHRRLQAIIQARGKIHLSELESELHAPLDLLKEWLYDLVNRGRLVGYVDWEQGMVYSLDLDHLQDRTHCPHCGGETDLVGKGIIQCLYCDVEIFIPKVKEAQYSTPQLDVDAPTESTAFSFDAPTPPPIPQTGSRFQQLRDLFKLSKKSKWLVIISTSILLFMGFCLGVSLLLSFGWGIGILMLVIGLPVVAFFLVIGAFIEKKAPQRAILWSGVTLILSLSGLLFAVSISVEPDTGNGFSLTTSLTTILMMVAPVVLFFSLPALYFGFKSLPQIKAVLQLQLKERALKLINEKGEISFAEIARSVQMPFDEVDNLVDKLLRSGELQGTFFSNYQRVYTAKCLAIKRKAVLETVATQGQIHLDEISKQLQAPYDLLRDWIYQLVQLHQFNGYINWDEGLLFSLVAEEIGSESQCPNCGGTLGLTGDVIQCQHCGSEIFRS